MSEGCRHAKQKAIKTTPKKKTLSPWPRERKGSYKILVTQCKRCVTRQNQVSRVKSFGCMYPTCIIL